MIQMKSKKMMIKVVVVAIGLFLAPMLWHNVGEAAEPIHMKFSTFVGPSHPSAAVNQNFVKELTAASKGQVIVDYYGAEALGKANECWDLIEEGLADMGPGCIAYKPAQFPLTSFMELPFFSNSSKTSLAVTQALLDKKLISKEFERVKVLFPVISPPAQIFSNKLFTKVEEFKGIRIMCGGSPLWPKTMGLLGGQCVNLPIPEIYVALERGTLDAGVVSWANSKGWRWVEVIKYPIDISMMGGFFCANVMNKKSWDKLSPEVQTAWTKVFEKYAPLYATAYDSHDHEGRKIFTDAGKKIIKISDAERERFAAKVMPVWQDWINTNEKAGRPGKQIYKTYLQVMKELGEPVAMKIPGL